MKLTHISIQNVAGVSSAQAATTAPITSRAAKQLDDFLIDQA